MAARRGPARPLRMSGRRQAVAGMVGIPQGERQVGGQAPPLRAGQEPFPALTADLDTGTAAQLDPDAQIRQGFSKLSATTV